MVQDELFGRMSVGELKRRIDGGEDLVIIDVLTPEFYELRHLPRALNACVFQVVFPDRVMSLLPDKDRTMVLYGSSAASRDAETAARKVLRLGYGRVFTLEGGLASWVAAGYPLEGKEPDTPLPDAFPPLPEGRFKVDPEASLIEWVGRNPTTRHRGTLMLSGGELTLQAGCIEGAFRIDMRSIRNLNLEGDPLQPVLEAHLKSDDFFFVEHFPEAVFTLDRCSRVPGAAASSPGIELSGRLDLCGIEADIRFPATLNVLADGRLAAEAHFDIDRTRWDVIYGSSRFFERLGMHLVYDLISLQVNIVAG